MKRFWKHGVCATALVGTLGWGWSAVADEEQNRRQQTRVHNEARVIENQSEYWIGLLAVPVDEALKFHLNLGERVIVEQVVPEGPADKAGFEAHDIVLLVGDVEIDSVQGLVSALQSNGDKEVAVTVLRRGNEHEIVVKPAKRPAGQKLHSA